MRSSLLAPGLGAATQEENQRRARLRRRPREVDADAASEIVRQGVEVELPQRETDDLTPIGASMTLVPGRLHEGVEPGDVFFVERERDEP